MLVQLTKRERKVIDRMLAALPVKARVDYLTYLQHGAYQCSNLTEMEVSVQLHQKGWLKEPCDMVQLNPVVLTREAWERFALDEWQEVEEEIMRKKRGDVYGSW